MMSKDKRTFRKSLNMMKRFSKKSVNDIDESSLMKMNKGPVKDIWINVLKLWAVVNNPKSDKISKAFGIGALIYLISPLDVIPDFTPILGLTDDVSIIIYAISQLTKSKTIE